MRFRASHFPQWMENSNISRICCWKSKICGTRYIFFAWNITRFSPPFYSVCEGVLSRAKIIPKSMCPKKVYSLELNKNSCPNIVWSLVLIDYILILKRGLVFVVNFWLCWAWAPEAWKPRFQILANLWKFKNRWNLKTWFLKIVYKRVSLSKIWAIHQNGRWRTILDPDRQPFLNTDENNKSLWMKITIFFWNCNWS